MLSNGRFAGFRSHPRLEGTHAFLSPSSPSWLRYTPEKLIERIRTAQAAALGTELHETASRNIKRGIKLLECPECPIIVNYVNDAIDLGMTPEQMLFYTINCYGTADTVSYEEYVDHEQYDGFLRAHDLKTGTSKVSMDQLYVYAAVFCLEYGIKPFRLAGELRIYQGDTVLVEAIQRDYLSQVYSTIRHFDEILYDHRMGGSI